jgi:hypothetical protein
MLIALGELTSSDEYLQTIKLVSLMLYKTLFLYDRLHKLYTSFYT